jgi:hypothetical protein
VSLIGVVIGRVAEGVWRWTSTRCCVRASVGSTEASADTCGAAIPAVFYFSLRHLRPDGLTSPASRPETERIAVPTFGEIVERLRALPFFEPSSNKPTPGPALPADAAIQGPAGIPPGDRPDSSTGPRFDHSHDADPHRIGQIGPGGPDDSRGNALARLGGGSLSFLGPLPGSCIPPWTRRRPRSAPGWRRFQAHGDYSHDRQFLTGADPATAPAAEALGSRGPRPLLRGPHYEPPGADLSDDRAGTLVGQSHIGGPPAGR